MEHISYCCQGESHKSTDKPCQDCAYSEVSPSLSMAIVCDGHGGERYFRSQVGSKIAVEVIRDAVKQFVETLPLSVYCRDGKSLFKGMPFTDHSEAKPYKTDSEHAKEAEMAHEALTALFSSIIAQWNEKIDEHAKVNDLDEWEKAHVPQKIQERFTVDRNDPNKTFEKTYGCTLMVYVQTPDFWFAFHLGDGKFLRYQMEDGKPVFDQPIPWDEKCFLNKTTSICDSKALDEVRYCYEGDGHFPDAVFLGSDGIDDSYGDGENLTNFYVQLYKLIAKSGREKAEKDLQKSLPIISKHGSKDDMSIACIYNEKPLKANALSLVEYQISIIEKKQQETASKIATLDAVVAHLKETEHLTDKEKIDLHYKEKDLVKAHDLGHKLWGRKMHLCQEKKRLESSIVKTEIQ